MKKILLIGLLSLSGPLFAESVEPCSNQQILEDMSFPDVRVHEGSIYYSDDLKVTLLANGLEIFEYPGCLIISVYPSGTEVVQYPNGEIFTYFPSGADYLLSSEFSPRD